MLKAMTIIEVLEKFPNNESCISYLEKVRWNNTPLCPYCGVTHTSSKKQKDGRYMCRKCQKNYRVTVGTIFHDTKVPLQKWFLLIGLMLNAKKGISSTQLARDCGLNQKTAWYMAQRVRKSMSNDKDLLSGIVEMDETYVGGKPRKPNVKVSEYDKKDNFNKRGRGSNKTPVLGIVERNGKVIAKSSSKVNKYVISKMIKDFVDCDKSIMITDEAREYAKIDTLIEHLVITHKERFAYEDVHTNNIEGFWSIVKRGIKGIFQKVSNKYLDNYLLEFSYKYNNRNASDKFIFFNTLDNMILN